MELRKAFLPLALIGLAACSVSAPASPQQDQTSSQDDMPEVSYRGGEEAARAAAKAPFAGICFFDSQNRFTVGNIERIPDAQNYSLQVLGQSESLPDTNPPPVMGSVDTGGDALIIFDPELQSCSRGLYDPTTQTISASPFKFRFVSGANFSFTDGRQAVLVEIFSDAGSGAPQIRRTTEMRGPTAQSIGELAP